MVNPRHKNMTCVKASNYTKKCGEVLTVQPCFSQGNYQRSFDLLDIVNNHWGINYLDSDLFALLEKELMPFQEN